MLRLVLATVALVGVLGRGAGAQVALESKWPEGTTLRTVVAAKVAQTLTIAGQEVKTRNDVEVRVRSASGKRREDGTLPVEVTMESLRMDLSVNGTDVAVDSAEKDPKVDVPGLDFLGPLVKAYAGVTYTVVLGPKLGLKGVEGVEKNLDRVNDLPEAAAGEFRSQINADRIKAEYDEMAARFPDGLVREGEPWERTETSHVGSGQTLTFTKRYEYRGTVAKDGKTLDRIDVRATEVRYKQDPDAKSPVKVTKSDLKVESSEGSILFDREAGREVESHEKTRVVGDLTMTIQDKELPSKLDLTLDTTRTTGPAR